MSKENWVATAAISFLLTIFVNALVHCPVYIRLALPLQLIVIRKAALNKIIQDSFVYKERYLSKNLCILTENLQLIVTVDVKFYYFQIN